MREGAWFSEEDWRQSVETMLADECGIDRERLRLEMKHARGRLRVECLEEETVDVSWALRRWWAENIPASDHLGRTRVPPMPMSLFVHQTDGPCYPRAIHEWRDAAEEIDPHDAMPCEVDVLAEAVRLLCDEVERMRAEST